MFIDKREHAVDQLLRFEIGNRSERTRLAEVLRFIGVAAGTPQRTLASDLDRKGRIVPGKDSAPGFDDV
jgi:hypothetical protein